MKRTVLSIVFLAAVASIVGLPASGQETEERPLARDRRPEIGDQRRRSDDRIRVGLPGRRVSAQQLSGRIIYLTPEMKKTSPQETGSLMEQVAGSTTIPMWNYSTLGYDGKPYAGVMVGRSPFFHGARTTNIRTVIVPIIFNIGGTIFDPTVKDTACGLPASAVTLIQQSPLLSNVTEAINGVNVGTGQYTDIFQRSSFWTDVSITGNNYHTVLSPVTVLSPITETPTSTDAIVATGGAGCGGLGGNVGVISNTWFDGLLQNTIIPSLAPSGVGPTVFPIFLLYNVVQSTSTPPTVANCCILGYHGSFGVPLQTYSPLDFDGVQAFGAGFTSTMSHEIAEWMDDPNGGNAVPPWGAEGQQSGCQTNLEVGDPLSPGFATPTNEFSIGMPNGVTYDLQELAYYSWFFGGTSLGAGSKYSDNGTFTGFAKACPPGGTN